VESECVFVNLLELELEWSRSFVSNYKIETKNDVRVSRVKRNFDVTIGFPNFKNSESK